MSDTGIFIEGIDRLLLDFSGRRVAAAREVTDDPWVHGGESATAIVLAAAAVEAHVGEWLAEHGKAAGIAADTSEAWIDKHLSVANIVKNIFKHLDGPSVGNLRWYDGLRALCELRNHVVHYYPKRRKPGKWPKRLRPIIKNHTLEPAGDESMDWTSRLLVASVAEQALCLATEGIRGFDTVVSDV
jgi:hypothetical protein